MRTLPACLVRPLLLAFFLVSLPALAQDPGRPQERHTGTAPRASAAKYRSHAESKDGFSVGAELLSKKDASKVFAADVNRCCLVVHVAVYPKKDEPIELSLLDFMLNEVGADKPVRPESSTTVAAKLATERSPRGGVGVSTVGSVGYESGTYPDPLTGKPVHTSGVSTSAGVGVEAGNVAPPDIADRDRQVMERELYEKGLPEGKASVPVAGYLFFPILHTKKDAKYRLIFSGRSEPLTLPLQ